MKSAGRVIGDKLFKTKLKYSNIIVTTRQIALFDHRNQTIVTF